MITFVQVLISLLIATHEPSSRVYGCGLGFRVRA